MRIGDTYNKRKEGIDAIDLLIAKIDLLPDKPRYVSKAACSLAKIREELWEEDDPMEAFIRRGLSESRRALSDYPSFREAQAVWRLFGFREH